MKSKIKSYLFNLYEYLQEEPDFKHPRLRIIPTFVFNLLALFIQVSLMITFLTFVFNLIFN